MLLLQGESNGETQQGLQRHRDDHVGGGVREGVPHAGVREHEEVVLEADHIGSPAARKSVVRQAQIERVPEGKPDSDACNGQDGCEHSPPESRHSRHCRVPFLSWCGASR